MSPARIRPLLLFLAAAALFLAANRAAYKGYFDDDGLENLSMTRDVDSGAFFDGFLTLHYFENNFRPVGHLFFRTMGHLAGLNFPPYVAALHIAHLLNVALLWLILRRLALPIWAAAAGMLFFTFHMAEFALYWQPSYVFDLLCGTFSLLTLLLWIDGRWILSLVSFWLAYRAKEIAVMLPMALAAYELWIGKRRWERLIPFFAISLWFGVRGLLQQAGMQSDSEYQFHFQPWSIGKAIVFYISKTALLPVESAVPACILILLAVGAAVMTRNRRVWFGLLLFAVMLMPMGLMSERLRPVYLYVPLIGLSIAIAALAALAEHRWVVIAIASAFLLWIPWNYANLRWLRREEFGQAADRHRYVAGIEDLSRSQPGITSFVYRDAPLKESGAKGISHWFRPGASITIGREDTPEGREALAAPEMAVLYWNRIEHRLEPAVRTTSTADSSYVQMGPNAPIWQLSGGWLANESYFRWTHPHATARLSRPAGATEFELVVNVGPEYIARLHTSHVVISLDGRPIGSADFDSPGLHTARWKLAAAEPGPVEMAVDTSPVYQGDEPLGIAVCAFGFKPGP